MDLAAISRGMKAKRFSIQLVTLTVFVTILEAHAQTYPYVLHDLGTLGGTSSYAWALNSRGQVTGSAAIPSGDYRAFLTGPNGTGPPQNLGIIPGPRSSDGFAVNDNGQVAGRCWTNGVLTDPYIAFISGPNGGPLQQLPTLGGAKALANGMNVNAEVVGASEITTKSTGDDTSSPVHAFVTGPNGTGLVDLGTLGGRNSSAYAINNLGQITGGSEYAAGRIDLHPFLTSTKGEPMKDLGTLGGEYSRGYGINVLGQVTGSSLTTPGGNSSHAFVSGPNGGVLTDLGTLGGNSSNGNGINDYGVVVGESNVSGSSLHHGFVAMPGTAIQDLNSVIDPATGFIIYSGTAINNFGQIAAYGENAARSIRAVLLTPLYLESFNIGIRRISKSGSLITVEIRGSAEHTYQLQRNASIEPADPDWQNIGDPVRPEVDGTLIFSDSNVSDGKAFYRVVLTP